MKKRKELDALLMNGKKSRPKRTKDGHELLQNSESESNSSELDEYVVQTRRQTTRRRKGVICSICLRLLVFILVVGCITVTAGVMWMHFELKNDLDSLRKELIQVQSMVDTSQSQSSSIINLNKEMQSLPSLTTKVGLLNETISSLNASIVGLKANILSLQERAETHTVQEARNLEDINQFKLHLKSLKADAASNQTSLTNLINALKVNLSTLQTQVSAITQDPSKTQPAVEPVTADNAIKSLQESIDSLNSSFSEINATMFNLSAEVTSIKGPVAPPLVVDTTGVVNVGEVLDSLWRNVTHLNEVINQELSSDEPPDARMGDTTPAEWQSDVAERLVDIENQIKTLLGPDSPSSGNSSSADDLYAAFKEEIRGPLASLKADHQGVTLRLDANENELKDLRDQVVKLDIRVVDLEVNPLLTGDAVLIPNQTDIAGGVPPAVTPTPQSESTPTLAPPPPAATLEQEGKNVTSTDGQDSDGKPPAEPTSKAGPEPAGPKTEPSGEQPPAAETPSEGAPVNDTPGDEEPETAAEGSLNGTTVGETEGTTVGETKKMEPEGTTSEPELDTQLSLLTGAANASRSMRSASFGTEVVTELQTSEGTSEGITTGMVSAGVGETTHSKTTTQDLRTTKSPPPVLKIRGITTKRGLKASFHTWDRNMDHILTYNEFSRISNFHRKPPSQEDFLAYDQDHNSGLSQAEMIAAMNL